MRILIVILFLAPLAVEADTVIPAEMVQDSVNIRLEPDADSEIVGELRRGDSVPHVASVEGWHEVELEGGATGFVSVDWSVVREDVAEPGTEEQPVVEEEPQPEPEPVVEEAPQPEPVAEQQPAAVLPPEPILEEEPLAPPAAATSIEIKADRDRVVKLRRPGQLGNSQIFDDGNMVGIATTNPRQRLEVNGSIQIHDQNSNLAGLIITQSAGDSGYIMHNRANTLTIGAGSIDRVTIDRDGNFGIGVARPEHPLELASGAHVTAGGVWTNRSARGDKRDIVSLSEQDAIAAVMALQPVSFRYKAEAGEQYIGFIAEDVPRLLASDDRESLSSMDIVAALTKVVQEQQRRIEALESRLESE